MTPPMPPTLTIELDVSKLREALKAGPESPFYQIFRQALIDLLETNPQVQQAVTNIVDQRKPKFEIRNVSES